MQILSPDLSRQYRERIINMHHSFLPGLHRRQALSSAFQRGVKLIGATSHYVTEGLDDGPIIEQDVVRISHRDQMEDLLQKAVTWKKSSSHAACAGTSRIACLLYGKKTVVFHLAGFALQFVYAMAVPSGAYRFCVVRAGADRRRN